MSNTQDPPVEQDRLNLDPAQESNGYIDQILDTDLNTSTLSVLENLITDDWVLSNLNDAEVHEQKWLSRVIKLEAEGMHPHQKSLWAGETVAYSQDETGRPRAPHEEPRAAEPLSDNEQAILNQLIHSHIARLTRSRDMSQQEIFRTTIQRAEREDMSEDNEGWL